MALHNKKINGTN